MFTETVNAPTTIEDSVIGAIVAFPYRLAYPNDSKCILQGEVTGVEPSKYHGSYLVIKSPALNHTVKIPRAEVAGFVWEVR